jgi:putative membrane protein
MTAAARTGTGLRRPDLAARVPWLLAAAAAGAQLPYPLLDGAARQYETAAVVLLFAAASFSSAARSRGVAAALRMLAATAGVGFLAEIVGVHTGVPFGSYSYAGSLGPRLAGVPALIAAAWVMLSWPAAVAARRLVRGRALRIVLGAWALTAWDVFLDPQMVAAGHWHWRSPGATLPGVADVPVSNFAGWFLVGLVVSALLQTLLDRTPDGEDGPMYALYIWTWISSAVALGGLLHLAAAAAWGFVAMGSVAVPLLWRLRRRTG